MRRSGFSLVELLVSGVLSTIVIGAAIAIFTSSHQAYQTSGRMSEAQQSVRAALDIIATDLQMAGLGGQNTVQVGSAANPNAETALGPNCVNNTGAPDVIQFRVGGAVSVVTQQFSASNGATNITVDVHDIPPIPGDGQDYFQAGMNVDLLDVTRVRVAQAVVGDLGSVNTENQIMLTSFSNVTATTIWPGTMIVQQPVWVTYEVIGQALWRCVRDTPTETCDGSLLNNLVGQEIDFVVVENIADIQYSYLVDPGWANSGANGADFFNPGYLPDSLADRQAIRGVKIELLVRSKNEDYSVVPSEDTVIKRKYFLGGDTFDVADEDARFAYTQMATIVNLPNAALN